MASVLILGGGAAGLAAAQKLAVAGVRTTLLEARDRLGGRIHTLRANWPAPIEAGPEFIHGDSPELKRLLEQAKARTEELPDRHLKFADGKPRQMDFEHAWEAIFDSLKEMSGSDRTFAELIDVCCQRLSPEERAMAIDYVEGFNAADFRTVSAVWLRNTEMEMGAGGDESICRVTSGYDQMVNAILSKIDDVEIHLNTRATSIRWERGWVHADVTGGDGSAREYVATHLIVTLPLGVLQRQPPTQGSVAFVPDVPAKREAMSQLAMGAVVKVVFWFRRAFWKELGIIGGGFLHVPRARFMTWWPLGDSLMLTGWSGGPRAVELSANSDDSILSTAVSELARGLATDEQRVRELLLDAKVFNWQADPLAGGAYSYAKVGGADAARKLAAPVENTLFFAGEATDDLFPATVAGALRTGNRAADEVLKTID